MEQNKSNRELIYDSILKNFKIAAVVFTVIAAIGLAMHYTSNDLSTFEMGCFILVILVILGLLVFTAIEKRIKISTRVKIRVISYALGVIMGGGYFIYVNHNPIGYGFILVALIPGILTLDRRNFWVYHGIYLVVAIFVVMGGDNVNAMALRAALMMLTGIVALGVRRSFNRVIDILESSMEESGEMIDKQKNIVEEISNSSQVIDQRVQSLKSASNEVTSSTDNASGAVEGISHGAADKQMN